jgi:hypothetical protein
VDDLPGRPGLDVTLKVLQGVHAGGWWVSIMHLCPVVRGTLVAVLIVSPQARAFGHSTTIRSSAVDFRTVNGAKSTSIRICDFALDEDTYGEVECLGGSRSESGARNKQLGKKR